MTTDEHKNEQQENPQGQPTTMTEQLRAMVADRQARDRERIAEIARRNRRDDGQISRKDQCPDRDQG